MKANIRGLSIFHKLLIAFLSMAILMNGIVMSAYYVFSHRTIGKKARENSLERSYGISHYFGATRQTMDRVLLLISQNPLIHGYLNLPGAAGGDARVIQKLFMSYINAIGDFESISLIDDHGRERVKVSRTGPVRASVERKGKGLYSEIRSGVSGVVNFEEPRPDSEGNVFFSAGLDITDDETGRFRGAVIIRQNMDSFMESLGRMEFYTETPVWVFNADGELLRRPLITRSALDPTAYPDKGFKNLPVLKELRGGILLYRDHSLENGKPFIRTIINLPNETLYKDFTRTLKFLWITFLISLVVASFAAFYISKYLSEPVERLAMAAVRIAKGDFTTPIKTESGEVGFLIDTFNRMSMDLSQARDELVAREKMATLGQLSAGIGHELRNPLGVITNAVFYLKTIIPGADKTVMEYLNIIQDEVGNSHRIISDLLDLARKKVPEPRPTAVRQLISQSLSKCGIPSNVSVKNDIPVNLPKVKIDLFQMGRVLQNLITNGVQAMPKGGVITLRAEECIDTCSVKVSVTDSGEGISPENMERLFQPLFTTKARGLGLGLLVSKKMTEANGGEIRVDSRFGEGSTFSVTLPAEVPEIGK